MPKSKLDFKMAVGQIDTTDEIEARLSKMVACIDRARKGGAKMIVFPEMATAKKYLWGDDWEYDSFIREITDANEKIREASKGIICIWGSVRADWDRIGEDGRVRKYNAVLIAQDGHWVTNGRLNGWMPKTNLPEYRFFDDKRHFYPAAKLAAELEETLFSFLRPFPVTIDGEKLSIGLTVCEDIWEDEYDVKPAQWYGKKGVDLLICVSQSPWTVDKWKARDKMLQRRAKDVMCPILYVNSVGLQNNAKNLVWFDGGSCFMGADGKMKWTAPSNREDLSIFFPSAVIQKPNVLRHVEGIKEKYDATIAAMIEFYKGYKRVIIGLSGGIDSAVALAMHVKALGAERVLAVNMPTKFNSWTTRSLAEKCAKNFGVEYRVVSVQEKFEASLRQVAEAGYSNPSDFDCQNEQARLRGSTLAFIAANEATKLGGRTGFTCNGNKTEVALNYFTLYGDGAGCSAFLAGYWKGEVYELAHHINGLAGRDMIPRGIIDIVPSAELSATQNVDEGKGDPIFYPFHDKLLKAFLVPRWDPEVIIRLAIQGTLEEKLGCASGTIKKYFPSRQHLIVSIEWAWREFAYAGKRHMLPPAFVTDRREFGFDYRQTIDSAHFTKRYQDLLFQYLFQQVLA